MKYTPPGEPGSIVSVETRYENFIGGKWLPPAAGQVPGEPEPGHRRADLRGARKSTPEDVEHALDAAHAARTPGARPRPRERAEVLNAVADAIEAHREMLAVAESWENGKPVRETLAADIPLAADHFRYFAAAARGRGEHDDRDRQGHDRLPLPRAARRGRPDHPVQLPAADGGVEARPGAGGGELRRCSSPPRRRRGRSSSWPRSSGTSSRPACSTSSTGPAARSARRWPQTRGSPRSRSPVRPSPGG